MTKEAPTPGEAEIAALGSWLQVDVVANGVGGVGFWTGVSEVKSSPQLMVDCCVA